MLKSARWFVILTFHTALAVNDDLPSQNFSSNEVTTLGLKTTRGDSATPIVNAHTTDDEESDRRVGAQRVTNGTMNGTIWAMDIDNTTEAMTVNVSTRRPSPYWKYCNMTDITPYQLDYYWMWEVLMVTRVYMKLPLALIGVFGNSLSFIVLRKEKRNSSTFLLLILAVIDLCVCLGYISHELIMALYDNTFALVPSRTHPVYHDWRRIVAFLDLYLGRYLEILSGWIIALISIDRYIAVCKPLLAPTLSTVARVRFASIFVIFVNALLVLGRCFSFTYVDIWSPCTDENVIFLSGTDLWNSVPFQLWYVTVTYGGLTLILPVAIVIVVQVILINHLRKARRDRACLTGDANAADKVTLNLTLTLVVVAIVFFLCVIPEFVVFIVDVLWVAKMAVYTGKYDRRAWIYSANLVRFLNSVINFFIYCLLRQGFRKRLVDLFCSKCRTKQKLSQQQKSMVTTSTDTRY